MTDDPEKAELRKKLAQAERRLRATQAEMAEIKQCVTNFEKAEAALMKFYARGPRTKKKSGRPGFWKSSGGLAFVEQVEEIAKERKCKIATAIRIARKKTLQRAERSKASGFTNDPAIARAARLAKLSDDALQARFQEARWYWLFMVDFDAWRQKQEKLNRDYDQALAALQKAPPKATVPDVSYDFSPWPSMSPRELAEKNPYDFS
jgi:hypothetical protein